MKATLNLAEIELNVLMYLHTLYMYMYVPIGMSIAN